MSTEDLHLSCPLYERHSVIISVLRLEEMRPHIEALGVKNVVLYGPFSKMPWGEGLTMSASSSVTYFYREVDGLRFCWVVEYPVNYEVNNDEPWAPAADDPIDVIPYIPAEFREAFANLYLPKYLDKARDHSKIRDSYAESVTEASRKHDEMVAALKASFGEG